MLILLFAVALQTVSPAYRDCVAHVDHQALGNNQMFDCITTDMDRADAALNRWYRQAMRHLPPERAAILRADERRWIDQRRARCQAASQSPIPTPEINRMRCLVRETDRRTAFITRFR